MTPYVSTLCGSSEHTSPNQRLESRPTSLLIARQQPLRLSERHTEPRHFGVLSLNSPRQLLKGVRLRLDRLVRSASAGRTLDRTSHHITIHDTAFLPAAHFR
jgi:hypothetical protein